MKIRVKDSASSKRVVVTLDDNSCIFGQLISEVAHGLNIARESIQLSLNHGKTIITASEESKLSDLGIVSGDLITCLSAQNNKTCDEPQPATRPRITEQPSVEKSETPSVAITPESASLHHNQMETSLPQPAVSEDVDSINKYLNCPALLRESTEEHLPESFCELIRENQPDTREELLILACHQLLLESGFICQAQSDQELLLRSTQKSSGTRQFQYSHFLDPKHGDAKRCTVAFVILGNNLIVHGLLADIKTNPCITISVKQYVTGEPGNIRIHKPQNLSMKFKDEFIQQLTLNMKEVLGLNTLPPVLDLPYEVTLMVLKLLGYKSVIRLGQTCKSMHNMCMDNQIWRRMYLRDFTGWVESYRGNVNWYEEYKNKIIMYRRQREHERRMRSFNTRQPPVHPMIPRGDPFLWLDERLDRYGDLEELTPPFDPQRYPIRRPNPAAELDPSNYEFREHIGANAIDGLQGIGVQRSLGQSHNNSHPGSRMPRIPQARFM